jgi:hypothetical protein
MEPWTSARLLLSDVWRHPRAGEAGISVAIPPMILINQNKNVKRKNRLASIT